jgi:tRNA pseudouridine38-40 synthase
MIRTELHSHEVGTVHLIFEANGFLRHMVRNIVGTIVEVGQKKRGFDQFAEIFRSKDRRMAGIKAPPQGLFLIMARY